MLAALIFPGPSAFAAEAVGRAVDISTQVSGQGGALARGDDIHRDERIRSNASGVGAFMFADGTKLAVGPNSTVVIDQYVYAGGNTVKRLAIGATKGTLRWKASTPVGPLVAQRGNVVVAQAGSRAVWLTATTGRQLARTGKLPADEPAYAATRDTVVYLTTGGSSGRDLATGKRLWHRDGKGHAVVSLLDWAYVWRKGARGDVLSARTGKVLVKNKVLPSILYANDAGVLLNADDGYRWVSF